MEITLYDGYGPILIRSIIYEPNLKKKNLTGAIVFTRNFLRTYIHIDRQIKNQENIIINLQDLIKKALKERSKKEQNVKNCGNSNKIKLSKRIHINR